MAPDGGEGTGRPREEDEVPFTRQDRMMQKQTHDSVIRIETLLSESIKPRLESAENEIRRTRTYHKEDVDRLDGRIDENEGRINTAEGATTMLKWGLGTLIAILGVVIAAATLVSGI